MDGVYFSQQDELVQKRTDFNASQKSSNQCT